MNQYRLSHHLLQTGECVIGREIITECFVADLFLSSLFLQVSIGVPSQHSVFTFVPSVWKLPIESIITEEARFGAGSTNKVQQQQHILQNHIMPSLFILTPFMMNHSTKCM